LGGLSVPIEWWPVPAQSWHNFFGTENYLLPLQGTEAQFCCLPVSRQVAMPTKLSAASFASAEDRRREYAAMRQQTAEGRFWIRNFIIRRNR